MADENKPSEEAKSAEYHQAKKGVIDAGEIVTQLHAYLFEMILITRHQQQVGAKARQFARDGVANALAGTGDQGGVAMQLPSVNAAIHGRSLKRHSPARIACGAG